jgi:hypothetical protein
MLINGRVLRAPIRLAFKDVTASHVMQVPFISLVLVGHGLIPSHSGIRI